LEKNPGVQRGASTPTLSFTSASRQQVIDCHDGTTAGHGQGLSNIPAAPFVCQPEVRHDLLFADKDLFFAATPPVAAKK
jgi:hypothetical protein